MEMSYLPALQTWSPLALYAIIFLGLMLEGEFVLFLSFYFVRLDHLDAFMMTAVAILAVLAGDSLWYLAGRYLSDLQMIQKFVHKISKGLLIYLQKNPKRTIIISKFMYGIHHPILLHVAMAGITYPRFVKADIPGIILWVSVIGSLGYLFSASVQALHTNFKYAEIGLLFAVVCFFVTSKVMTNYFSKRIESETTNTSNN